VGEGAGYTGVCSQRDKNSQTFFRKSREIQYNLEVMIYGKGN